MSKHHCHRCEFYDTPANGVRFNQYRGQWLCGPCLFYLTVKEEESKKAKALREGKE